jgi:hypothetical protein
MVWLYTVVLLFEESVLWVFWVQCSPCDCHDYFVLDILHMYSAL